jgi:predicted nucleic acid-binding protein
MEVIDKSILPFVELVGLSGTDCVDALRETESRGVRGGAVHDYLHLAAARSCGATQLYTLDDSNFSAFHRTGDPAIVHPNSLRR